MDFIQVESVTALERLGSDLRDTEIVRVVDLVTSRFDDVKSFIEANNSSGLGGTEGMCLLVSRFVNEILRKDGFRVVVLQGEIEIGENSWLEHHLSLVHLTNYWAVIDFTAEQLEGYKGVPLLVLLCRPRSASLLEALRAAYDWWTPD